MGRYQNDLKTILTLLGAGLDPMTGLGMYTDALNAKRERADERAEDREFLLRDTLPTLQSGADWEETRATLNSLGEAYDVGDNVLAKTKEQVLDDFYGGSRSGENAFAEEGETDISELWDASDEEKAVEYTTQMAQAGYGRAEIRERLRGMMLQAADQADVDKVLPYLDETINLAYQPFVSGPTAVAGTQGHAVPENDTLLGQYDNAGVGYSSAGGLKSLGGGPMSEREKLAAATMAPPTAPPPPTARPTPQPQANELIRAWQETADWQQQMHADPNRGFLGDVGVDILAGTDYLKDAAYEGAEGVVQGLGTLGRGLWDWAF